MESGELTGRWPTNLVLVHTQGCQEQGVSGPGQQWAEGGNRPAHCFNPDGTETVPSWECHPTCPVPVLDAQSGERPVSGTAASGRIHRGTPSGAVYEGGWPTIHRRLPNDSGGASRFFPQFPSEAALDDWLLKLIMGAHNS